MSRPRLLSTLMLGLLLAASACSQEARTPAEVLLAESIAYHDPEGVFMERLHQLDLRETRPGAPDRQTTIAFHGAGTELTLHQQRDGRIIDAEVGPDNCRATVDGSAAIPDSLAERYRLTCEGLRWVRDYYAFLFALPMKLQAPGTRLEPGVSRTTFQGDSVRVLRATFDAEVGTDTWLLYFDPASHALMGYRFYHDEAAGDGEYVVLGGEVEEAGIRLPRERRWYVNADDRFLGADVIEHYEVQR